MLALGVSRSSVHFVENYKVDSETENEQVFNEDQQNALMINYRALKVLHECT